MLAWGSWIWDFIFVGNGERAKTFEYQRAFTDQIWFSERSLWLEMNRRCIWEVIKAGSPGKMFFQQANQELMNRAVKTEMRQMTERPCRERRDKDWSSVRREELGKEATGKWGWCGHLSKTLPYAQQPLEEQAGRVHSQEAPHLIISQPITNVLKVKRMV